MSFAFKAMCVALMLGAPLVGVWVATSLAAFANRATWLPVVAGLLVFPAVPLAWEGVAALRAGGAKARRILTFTDRLVLRTLGTSALFLGVLLAAFPTRAFVALSARGDWMLDGHHGPAAERARRALLDAAGALEWLYRAARDNPYREGTRGEASSEGRERDDGAPSPSGAGAPLEEGAERRYPLPAELHPVVQAMPREAEATIEAVGRYIAEREPDALLRVKALHDWVVDRVAYDVASYLSGTITAEANEPEAVLRTRVAVCAGYAKLLVALGEVTGDEIVYVVGDARSSNAPMLGEPHAWNAARVDGAWYLLDPTWNAGTVDGEFKKGYRTDYLFVPPELLAISHHPDEAQWQLLAEPVSRADFFRRPVLAPRFFSHGLELLAPERSQVTTQGSLEVVLGNPAGKPVQVALRPKDGGAWTSCAGDDRSRFQCAFPSAGTFDVTLFVGEQKAQARHEQARWSGVTTYESVGSIQALVRP